MILVRNVLFDLRIFVPRKVVRSEEKGKICKLYALIKVRIVKILRFGSFVLCRSKISEFFCFLKHGSRYV